MRLQFTKKSPPQRTAVDLFCGAAAGWTLGLSWAGVKVVAAVEKDEERARSYAPRWGHPVFRDIADVKARAVRGRFVLTGDAGMAFPARFVARIDRPWLVCGSPPCKGISEVNQKGKGVDDDGLFFEAIRLSLELRPPWISLENVDRLRTRGLDRVLEQLEAAGYASETLSLGSDCAGKDHERRRIVIVAGDTKSHATRGEGRPSGFARPAVAGSVARRRDLVGQPLDRRGGVGHLRAEALGRHVRAYDGVSDRDAEFARHAYGDALDPIFPFLIARALIAWEEGRVLEADA